uniref:Secreted Defensin-like peptide n=1 Tax=Pristhesancus plagipennis TaxID=1955184 RepID=A0A2K8JM80_PRIPG|nr:secreted Defensin-like peptide [Pristhesancus plagipennis]
MKCTLAFLTLCMFAAVAYTLPVEEEDELDQYLQGVGLIETVGGLTETEAGEISEIITPHVVPANVFKKWCICRTKKAKWCLCRG